VPKIDVEQGIYRLTSTLSFEEGTFIEPLGCVIRGQRLSAVRKSDTLLIIGSGISGLLHLKLAKLKSVQTVIVTDVNPYRLEVAKTFGATFVIDAREDLPMKLKELNQGRLADKVVVCTGATQAALTALECVDKGGTVLFFAVPDPTVRVPLPITQFWRNEITLKTSYGAAPRELEESLKILGTRRLDVKNMITHKLSLKDATEGFRLMAEAGNSLKVILEPNMK
jgi:L-iditol 2-dehydrogenase